MLLNEYWKNEVEKANELADSWDPQIQAALLIARQLQNINTSLEQIRAQLTAIENVISRE